MREFDCFFKEQGGHVWLSFVLFKHGEIVGVHSIKLDVATKTKEAAQSGLTS